MSVNKEVDSQGAATDQWLYRRGELVLGPVRSERIGQLLFSGEIDPRTEVCPLGTQEFKALSQMADFKVQVAKAEAKRRVEALAETERLRMARRHKVAVGLISVVALAIAGLAAVGARYFAVHNPFKKLELAEISVEPPTIARIHSRHRDEDLISYPGRKYRNSDRTGRGERMGARMTSAADDSEGLQTGKFDQDAIHSVVASRQKSLYVCFSEEAGRNPKLFGKFPIEFVIGNDGKVSKLWVDNPEYKQGALTDCLLRELQKWRFQPYEGEQATVNLSFSVRGRG